MPLVELPDWISFFLSCSLFSECQGRTPTNNLKVMKVLPFKIPKPENELVRHQVDHVDHFYDKLHQHPEVQLTVLFRGSGNLIVGDYIGPFQPQELYLLGPDVPHVFRNDPSYYLNPSGPSAYSESLFYDLKVIHTNLCCISEFDGIYDFLQGLNGCYKVVAHQDYIKKRILQIRSLGSLPRVVRSLEVLQCIMQPGTLLRLNKACDVRNFSTKEGKRMEKVMRFIMEESHRSISLAEVAEVASMNKEAFCRFFKERTRKTLTEFLNEVRITNACHMLASNDICIGQVAAETGFTNLSYFNRVFRKLHGFTPKVYRNSILKGTAGTGINQQHEAAPAASGHG